MYIELSEERKQELEKTFEKEISNYQNKTICKEKFIYLIKTCNIIEFIYLYEKYIGKIESVRRFPEINLSENDYIETVNKANDCYRRTQTTIYPKKNTKKLVRTESMAAKRKNYKLNK